MNLRQIQPSLNRREVLAAACAAAGTLALGGLSPGGERGSTDGDGPYQPFKMGLQSYSLRGYTRDGRPDVQKSLAVTKELGVHFWEAFPAHLPMNLSAEALDSLKREFQDAEVKVVGYGVVHLSKDQDANRRIFDFAKTMGLEYLSADPDPAAFDGVDRLVEDYGIAVGIHNHGPGHRYDKIETIAKAIKDHHARIGCCIDTGHFLRSREDPVHAVKAFGARIYGVHLKDVKDAEKFTVLGRGDLRTVDLLKALLERKYSYCLALEYEENPQDPLADIKACLVEAKNAIAAAKA
ncbi:MAG: sugar phosphate isomerase/epimerase family protein [Isosphaeraceae bacterium]